MEYKFNCRYDNRGNIYGIEMVSVPENYVLSSFLWMLKKRELFPTYLSDLLANKNFGVENASFRFYNQMDWEDKAELEHLGGIKEGEICIYLYDDRSNYAILSEILFVQVFYDYSVKLLEVYRTDSSLPVAWAMDMEDSLRKLKHLIDAKKNM